MLKKDELMKIINTYQEARPNGKYINLVRRAEAYFNKIETVKQPFAPVLFPHDKKKQETFCQSYTDITTRIIGKALADIVPQSSNTLYPLLKNFRENTNITSKSTLIHAQMKLLLQLSSQKVSVKTLEPTMKDIKDLALDEMKKTNTETESSSVKLKNIAP